MGLLWKRNMSLFVLIILELVLVTYLVQSVLKRMTTDSTLLTKKKGGILASVRSPDVNNLSGLREKRYFKDRRFYPSRKVYNSHNDVPLKHKANTLDHSKKVKRNLRHTYRSRGIHLQRKSKQSEVPKHFSTIANNVSVPYNYSEEITACTFSFDQRSFTEARKNLSLLTFVNLFYINLSLSDGMSTPYNISSQQDMFRWQYVRKTQKILVQLPVDFDLITFFYLYVGYEESVLNIKLLYKNSNCPANIREATYSIQKLLWNELFRNSSKFYLCNTDIRNYIHWHDILYYITTIWVGYGLNCSEKIDDYGIKETQVSKEDLPLVTPVFCFVLSLQFVWMFVLLDVYMHKPPNFTERDSSFSYAYNDRPYGAKRVMKKLLFISCRGCYCRNPVLRFLGLVWLCILLPCGLYRTLLRYYLSQKLDQDYLTVIKPSEPLFLLTESETTCLVLDVIYATICPLVFVKIGEKLYHDFFNDNLLGEHLVYWCESHVCQRVTNCCICNVPHTNKSEINLHSIGPNRTHNNPQSPMENEENIPEIKEDDIFVLTNSRISDKFSKPFGILSSLIPCKHSNISQRNDERGCFAMFCSVLWHCLKCPIIFISNLLCCLFPIIPFSCQVYSACKDCTVKNIFQIGTRECPTCRCNSVCCRKLATDRNITHCNCIYIQCKCQIVICTVLKSFWALCLSLLLYALCVRPVISTFTFIFRSFTYFVFVALPIRSRFLHYTVTVLTTLAYFVKYLSKIIHMNADVLKYVFELTRENRPEEEIEEVDEKTFDYVHKRLTFVTKRLYLLCLKVLIVFMYLFITIETFIQKNKSDSSDSTGAKFTDIIGVLVLVFGPYAASIFLENDKGYVLSDENKYEIQQAFIAFQNIKSTKG